MKPLILVSLLLAVVLVFAASAFPAPGRAAPEWQTHAPSPWILGPIQGTDGEERTVLQNLQVLAQWNIPITAFHFDAPDWQLCNGTAQFRYSDTVLNRMRKREIRALFWLLPLIGASCPEYQVALANDYFVKDAEGHVIVAPDGFVGGGGSWIDFNNPAAVEYWHSLLDTLRARVGSVLGGFYTDNVRPDAPDGTLTSYSEAFGADLLAYTRANVPDGEVVFKRYGHNTPSEDWLAQNAHVAYVNDLPTDFSGLRTGIRRVFDTTQFMPLAFNEFSGFQSNPPPTAEMYIRRMHWGAFQPVMENVPKGRQPWEPIFPPEVVQAYRYYATLHYELQPYLSSYDRAAFENKTPIFRDMNLTQYSARLGDELFVKYVTGSTTKVQIHLPPGQWINYWNEAQVFPGNHTTTYATPLGREPIFIERGAIIPMQVRNSLTGHGVREAAGSLTVNVYPVGHSTFRYYDPANGWLTFDVKSAKQRLALCTLDQIPGKPLLWRINQVRSKPNFVRLQGGAVSVNGKWGNLLPERSSESYAARSKNGWYYDAAHQRLIVKVTTRGTACPAP